jgi:hypothetical protein
MTAKLTKLSWDDSTVDWDIVQLEHGDWAVQRTETKTVGHMSYDGAWWLLKQLLDGKIEMRVK